MYVLVDLMIKMQLFCEDSLISSKNSHKGWQKLIKQRKKPHSFIKEFIKETVLQLVHQMSFASLLEEDMTWREETYKVTELLRYMWVYLLSWSRCVFTEDIDMLWMYLYLSACIRKTVKADSRLKCHLFCWWHVRGFPYIPSIDVLPDRVVGRHGNERQIHGYSRYSFG